MTNYFTRTCFRIALTREQAQWAKKLHANLGEFFQQLDQTNVNDIDACEAALVKFCDEECIKYEVFLVLKSALVLTYDWFFCSDSKVTIIDTGLLVSAELSVDVTFLCCWIQCILLNFNIPHIVMFEWSRGCEDMLTPDAFGGGAAIISKRGVSIKRGDIDATMSVLGIDSRNTLTEMCAPEGLRNDAAIHD